MTDFDTFQIPPDNRKVFDIEAAASEVGENYVEGNFIRSTSAQNETLDTSVESVYTYTEYVRGIKDAASETMGLRSEVDRANRTEASNSIFGKIIRKIAPESPTTSSLSGEDYVEMESEIGGAIFGSAPEGHEWEFYCEDEQTWVWRDSTVDPQNGSITSLTTRYRVQGDRIIKSQDGQPDRYSEADETVNLYEATQQYSSQVARQVYHKQTS